MAGGTGGGETINGNLGNRSRSCGPSGLHSKIYFQPRSQSHRDSVFLFGAHGGVGGNVSVATDEAAPDFSLSQFAAGGRNQAGDLSQPADDARHDHGVLRADHGAAGRVWKLLSADSDWSAGYGVSRPEHAFVLDDVCGF